MDKKIKNNTAANLIWPLLILAVILLFNLIFTPNFFNLEIKDGHLFGSLIDILNRAAPVMLLAISMTMVIATSGIDISVGSIMAIAGSLIAVLLTQNNLPLPLAMMITILTCIAIGVWNGILISCVGIQPIITTLILLVAGRGIAQLITDGQIITFQNQSLSFIANGFFLGLPFPITIVIAILLITQLFSRKTALGLFIESVGNNPTSSRFAGINANAIKIFVYSFSGFCASIAGIIAASNIKAADPNNCGLNLEMDAILAVVIGGTSLDGGKYSLVGSMIGALIMQTLKTTILTRGVPVQATLIVQAIVVVIVCLTQSETFRKQIQAKLRRTTA